jgi:hypothetical protein
MWPLAERRAKLSKGLRIKVTDGKGIPIEDLPLPLINVSSKTDVVKNGASIRLPMGIERNAAKKFIT